MGKTSGEPGTDKPVGALSRRTGSLPSRQASPSHHDAITTPKQKVPGTKPGMKGEIDPNGQDGQGHLAARLGIGHVLIGLGVSAFG